MWPADRPNPSYPKPSDLIQTMVRARKHLDVSQSDLAELRGVAASTQHQWETGADTRLSTVYGIAEALGVRLQISIETSRGMRFHVHPDLPNPLDAPLAEQARSITEAIVELSEEKLSKPVKKTIYALLLWSAAQHPDPVAEWTRQDRETSLAQGHDDEEPFTDYTGAIGARLRMTALIRDAFAWGLHAAGITEHKSWGQPPTSELAALLRDPKAPPELIAIADGQLNESDARVAASALIRVPSDRYGDPEEDGPSLRMYLERTIFWTGAWAL